MESEERIALHRIDDDKAFVIAQTEAQAKQADAQALQTQLKMKMIKMMNEMKRN